MSVSEIDLPKVRATAARGAGAARNGRFQFLWPVLGITMAFLCTAVWCIFLIWIII